MGEFLTLEGVCEPLRDVARFRDVRVGHEVGTICWPNGADVGPDVPYAAVSGAEIRLSVTAR